VRSRETCFFERKTYSRSLDFVRLPPHSARDDNLLVDDSGKRQPIYWPRETNHVKFRKRQSRCGAFAASAGPDLMKLKTIRSQTSRSESGQTIILVAASMVTLLAMAALAIDVVSLYVARNEIQRAADAAALVGAKAIADSGVTSLPPNDGDAGAAEALAGSMATSAITALVNSAGFNQVAGGPVTWTNQPLLLVYNDPSGNNLTNDVTITVTLQRTNLPSFFSRIWGSRVTTTSATAVAEAYNPANMQSFQPIAPRCVKPWLVVNLDPSPTSPNPPVPFIDPTAGAVENNAVGETFYINADCQTANGTGCVPQHLPGADTGKHVVDFLPALLTPGNAQMYPSCAGGSDYEQSIAGCDVTPYSYYQCGNSSNTAQTSWDPGIDPNPKFDLTNSATALATECLIHATGEEGGQGQDTLNGFTPWSSPPAVIATGGPMAGQPVSTSPSVVTIPIIATPNQVNNPPYTVTIVGYMQAFVNSLHDFGTGNFHDTINITILNIVGCSNTPVANAGNPVIVGGNGNSPIAVRLVAPPPGP